MRKTAATLALVLGVAGVHRVQAAEHLILGRRLTVADPTGDPVRRKVVLLGKEGPASPDAVVGDPTAAGATLTVFTNGGTGVVQTLPVPGTGWRAVRGGFSYSNATTGGATRKVVVKRNAAGVFVLSATLLGSHGPVGAVPPNPGDSGGIVLEIAGGDRYCVTLGGAAGGTESRDDARLWVVKNAVAEACTAPPVTTTTTTATSSSSSSTSSTSTTTSSSSTSSTSTSASTSTMSSTSTSTTSSSSTSTSTSSSTSTTETTSSTTSSSTSTSSTSTSSTSTSTTSSTSSTSTTSTSSTTTSTESTTSTTSTSTTTSTTTSSSTSTTTSTTSSTTSTTLLVEVNLLYVHGLKNCVSNRLNAHNTLSDLESAVNAALPARIATWQTAHPGTTLVVRSARANVYTATASGIHPSDSTDPLDMDDWEVGDPGCSTSQQGDPCTSAYEWRYRLAQEIDRLHPAPRKNVVLIGHSAGARAAMEVAANVGTGGVGGHDWGVQGRIAGVVTVQGMVDALGSSKYNVAGITSFETACKNGDAIVGFGESCAPGNGFCEWAGRVDGFAAADWVAQNKRALMLTSWGSCSPSPWTGRSDGSLPYDAQASPWALGLDMTPAPGETWRPSHGQNYGSYCHSAITVGSDPNHATARDQARNRILDWLFVAAPRTAATGSNTTPSIAFNNFSATFTMGASCPVSELDDTITAGNKATGIDVVGVCKHPGFFDGDDHAVALGEFSVTNGSTCNGTYRWQQAHDSSNNHAATFWWKTRSLRTTGPDLINSLPRS